MKMFGYYAWHSFKNQVRKLLKSWVIIFVLACALMGGLIGYGAAVLGEHAEEAAAQEAAAEELLPEEEAAEGPGMLESIGLQGTDVIRLVIAAAVVGVLCFEALSADRNAGKIFLPADVNLLFASPMRPQSVLMFRLATQLGTALAIGIWLLFQLPNMVLNLGLSLWVALAIIVDLCLLIMTGKLVQVLLYLNCSLHPKFKANLSRGVYALLGLLAVIFIVYWKQSGLHPLAGAVRFFTSRGFLLLPVVGWLAAFGVCAVEGSFAGVLLSLAGVIAVQVLLAAVINRTEADFYEDAMQKSEETAAKLEQANAAQSGRVAMKQRKKDRADSLQRDGLNRGFGADIFFYKTMYNRRRFAHLGLFTKTSETYLAVAVITGLLGRFVFESAGVLVAALAFAAFVFFRAIGNPLEQDTKMGYFLMIPESARKKLFYSLMGGTLCCLLDLLPAMVLAVILLPGLPLQLFGWIPFILSLDIFASMVGTFIDLSVPSGAGKPVKQFAQIFFIYFGLLPDILILSIAIVAGETAIGAVGAAALNLLLGFVFFLLAAVYLEPAGGRTAHPDAQRLGDAKQAKKVFSRLGLSCAVLLVVASVLQIAGVSLLDMFAPQLLEQHPNLMWLFTFAPIYVVGVPVGLLILRKVPAYPPQVQKPAFSDGLRAVAVSIFFMILGNLLGVLSTMFIGTTSGTEVVNPLEAFAINQPMLLKLLFLVVLAPIIEEFVFRKALVDRMRPYGSALAVFTSGAMFGLFHGNLSQLFYAFLLGTAFAYVYLHTGKLRYSIALHVMINFMGSIVAPWLLEHADLGNMAAGALTGAQIAYFVYVFLLYGTAIAGLLVLLINRRRIVFPAQEKELPKGTAFGAGWLNVGMVLFVLACFALIGFSLAA